MQVTDYLSLGISPKFICIDTDTHAARSKNGYLLYVLTDCIFTNLSLTFNRLSEAVASANEYGGLTLKAGQWLPGVKSFKLASGFVLLIDPK